ncbi:hypothetical protein SLE2022_333750 [Rubroshorea leprosula]
MSRNRLCGCQRACLLFREASHLLDFFIERETFAITENSLISTHYSLSVLLLKLFPIFLPKSKQVCPGIS